MSKSTSKINDQDADTKQAHKTAQERATSDEIKKLLSEMPQTEDITCGFWIFKGRCLQRYANQTAYVLLYGLVGFVFATTYAYFNGTITTIEKRFKIPSKNTGIIAIGNNITQMIVSAVLSYYAGKGHRPRWIGIGILSFMVFCLLNAAPHFLYGPGETALSLTSEFGAIINENATQEAIDAQRAKTLCRHRDIEAECEIGEEGNLAPQLVLFVAQLASGIGGALYYTLGVAYMDDNTKKSKTPALLSLSYFFSMLGPAVGYALASFCLRVYIAPHLHPVISNSDPRWMGAWWIGWLLLGAALTISGILFIMLPKELPKAAARRLHEENKARAAAIEKNALLDFELEREKKAEEKASFDDMVETFKRLLTNKTLMHNNISSVFYFFGYMPYWIFTPKYIEIIYRQSASTSSMVTGSVAVTFSAIGVLLSGLIISKFKPRARYMAAWNVIVDYLTVVGILAYAFIGCPGNEQSMMVNIPSNALNSTPTCNSACGCDYIPYSPVCGANNLTYISACHAGCKSEGLNEQGKKYFYDCSCIASDSIYNNTVLPHTTELPSFDHATPGACPVDCFTQFVTFLAVMCFLKFIGASGRASNFLVTVRCVPEKDKTAAMGFGMMLMSMVTFIPSPIFFGWLLDRMCLVWGKTCTNQGNCWLYDPLALRYILNSTAAVFIAISGIFDGFVWYYVKDLKIFDDEDVQVEMKEVKKVDADQLKEKT